MKKLFFLCFIGTVLNCVSQNSTNKSDTQYIRNKDTLVVYSDVPGQAPSPKYTIRVRSAATNNQWISVFAHYTYSRALEIPDKNMINGPTPGGNSSTSVQHYPNATAGWSQTYGNIEMSRNQPVEVEIAAKDGFQIGGKDFVKATVRPAQKASVAKLVSGKIYFTITDPVQVAIDINGQMDDYNPFINPIAKPADGISSFTVPLHTITMFTNPVIKKPTLVNPRILYVPAGINDSIVVKNVNPASYDTIYFRPGVHNIGLALKIYPGKGVYIPGDAILYGTMNNWNVPLGGYNKIGEKIKIWGYGTLSGSKHAHPYYVNNPISEDHKGIGIDNPLNYTIQGVSIVDSPNFAVYTPSGSGGYLSFVKVIGWRANGDGLGNGDNVNDCFVRTNDDESYVRGNRKRVTYWKDNISAVFYMSAIWTTPILIEDCDILYCRSRGGGGAAFDMRADVPGGGVKSTQTVFRNMRFHDPIGNMKVFNLDACKGGTTGHTYNWIKFENISIASWTAKQSLLECLVAPWVDKSLTFDNVTFGGTLLTKANFGTYFNYNVNLDNIIFKSRLSYTIAATANGVGGSAQGGGSYSSGAVATVLAIPITGYNFLNWTENTVVVSTNLTYNFTVSQDRNLVANFQPIQVVTVTGVTLAPAALSLVVGAKGQLTATVVPSNATDKSVLWTSSVESVATVDANGLVTAKAVGTAIMTVRTNDGGYVATYSLSVSPPIAVTGVTINNCPKNNLEFGQTNQLTNTITPASATNKVIVWTSSNSSVVTVDTNGLLTVKGDGTATITVTTNDGGFTSSCIIIVNKPVVPAISITAITPWISGVNNPKVSGANRMMVVMVMGESNADFAATTVTYGGQNMTKQADRIFFTTGNRSYASIFTLNEVGVNAATSGDIAVGWSATPSVGFSISSVLLNNIDQSVLVDAIATNSLGGANTISTPSALTAKGGDMIVMCGATENNLVQTFNNDFRMEFESNATWGDGVSGYKMGTGLSEIPSFSQSGNGRMVICAFVAKVASSLSTHEVGNTAKNTVRIYPNPTSGQVNIDFSDGENNKEIKVFNVLGQLVYNHKTLSTSTQIDLRSLQVKGFVLVQVNDGKSVTNHKVLVK
jgi:uncharacterized protein YjdB